MTTTTVAADPLAFRAERISGHLNAYEWQTPVGRYEARNDGRGWRIVDQHRDCIGIEPTLVQARQVVEADVLMRL